jgi:hypothetical protein
MRTNSSRANVVTREVCYQAATVVAALLLLCTAAVF